MRPSSYPFGVNDKEKVASEKGTGSIFQSWRRYGQCPENTVPIRRMKRDDLLRARSAGRFSRLSHRTGPYPILPHNDYGPEYARAGLQGELYRGANAVIDVWSPSIEVGDVSKASITLISGSGLDINLIEAGWTVDRRLYNDDKPRFTACWTSDDFTETGCFNLECSGFVQTSNQVGLSASIEPVSTYGGDRFAFYLAIHQDSSTKNWWLTFEEEMVGYFPNSLFSNLGDGANFIFWGGTVSTLTAESDPKMGSGHFPEENYALASEIKQIKYLDSAWALQRPTKLDMIRQQPNCSNLTLGDDNSGVYLSYGGPGRNPSCP